MRRAHRIVLLGLATALAFPGLSTCASAQAPTPSSGSPERLTGTVRSLDHEARTFDLLTGVGHSLRIHRIQLPGGVTIEAQGAKSTAPELTPGCIVRVACDNTPAGTVASKVELIQTAAELRGQ